MIHDGHPAAAVASDNEVFNGRGGGLCLDRETFERSWCRNKASWGRLDQAEEWVADNKDEVIRPPG
jgi:hypothetical protein